ncbi:hypothetical protein BJ508DRAFT_331452 [Ascobolus immersus RN42]|uniref:Uncharacterized protein n=1 Tax=Ascobolus immersus RN42 TaxID=1160509 RepID=A0A3N4I2S8_ASCIM|nr:hypothetical protein BJ508DRAFT_331452 [Ascobolus immersus RN42]
MEPFTKAYANPVPYLGNEYAQRLYNSEIAVFSHAIVLCDLPEAKKSLKIIAALLKERILRLEEDSSTSEENLHVTASAFRGQLELMEEVLEGLIARIWDMESGRRLYGEQDLEEGSEKSAHDFGVFVTFGDIRICERCLEDFRKVHAADNGMEDGQATEMRVYTPPTARYNARSFSALMRRKGCMLCKPLDAETFKPPRLQVPLRERTIASLYQPDDDVEYEDDYESDGVRTEVGEEKIGSRSRRDSSDDSSGYDSRSDTTDDSDSAWSDDYNSHDDKRSSWRS